MLIRESFYQIEHFKLQATSRLILQCFYETMAKRKVFSACAKRVAYKIQNYVFIWSFIMF